MERIIAQSIIKPIYYTGINGMLTYPSLLPENMNLASLLHVTLKTRPVRKHKNNHQS
jgi:hypothetical protein